MSVGLRSLAVAYPDGVRTNDDIRTRWPDLVDDAERRTLARLWAPSPDSKPTAFDVAAAPYMGDPFRGTVERRILAPGEPILPIELRAARDALAAADLEPSDLDIVLGCSFLPDQIGIGNAVFIARELGIAGPAWNLETACSSATAGLQLATSLVRAGQARHVLVVISCSYSRVSDDADTFGWFLGDGCTAFVVGPTQDGAGWLGAGNIHTAETCGTFSYQIETEREGDPQIRVVPARAEDSGRALRDTAVDYLRRCVDAALRDADCRLSDIDFFAFNTPTAWYSDLCVRSLEIAPTRLVDVYPLYANIGPVLWPSNLHHGASLGRVQPSDRVLVYSVGSVSSAAAVIMKWGDVGLGPLPERVRHDLPSLADRIAVATPRGPSCP